MFSVLKYFIKPQYVNIKRYMITLVEQTGKSRNIKKIYKNIFKNETYRNVYYKDGISNLWGELNYSTNGMEPRE